MTIQRSSTRWSGWFAAATLTRNPDAAGSPGQLMPA
jgi:hypothetical protein